VSLGRHPVSGATRYSRNDAAALTIGLALAEQHGAKLAVLHTGDPANPALTDYLALGARSIEVLACPDDADDQAVAAALAARLQGYGLVLTGTRAEGAGDSGMLPYRLADALGVPLLGSAVEVAVDQGRVAVRQFLPKGVRRKVDAALPALVAVHPLANVTPRYAYARLRAGSIVPKPLGVARRAEPNPWRTTPADAKPIRLAAAEKRSGHARMLSATTTESRGGNVVNEGSPVEKAQVILAYLREHQLIDY
jgi:electron transfer flavoprotein beta subunit